MSKNWTVLVRPGEPECGIHKFRLKSEAQFFGMHWMGRHVSENHTKVLTRDDILRTPLIFHSSKADFFQDEIEAVKSAQRRDA